MDFYKIIGIVAGILLTLGYARYYYTIVRGDSKPNLVTWFIWTIVGGIIFFQCKDLGAVDTLWVALSNFIFPLGNFVLTLRSGEFKIQKRDLYCLIVAMVSLVVWKFFDNPLVGLFLCLIADFMAATATLDTVWRDPVGEIHEDRLAWTIGTVALIINLLAIKEWTIQIATQPVYFVLLNIGIVIPLFIRRKTKKNEAKIEI